MLTGSRSSAAISTTAVGASVILRIADVLRLHAGRRLAFGDDEGDLIEGVAGARPAASLGDGVRAVGRVVTAGAAHDVRGCAVRCSPSCSTSSLMLCPTSPRPRPRR